MHFQQHFMYFVDASWIGLPEARICLRYFPSASPPASYWFFDCVCPSLFMSLSLTLSCCVPDACECCKIVCTALDAYVCVCTVSIFSTNRVLVCAKIYECLRRSAFFRTVNLRVCCACASSCVCERDINKPRTCDAA